MKSRTEAFMIWLFIICYHTLRCLLRSLESEPDKQQSFCVLRRPLFQERENVSVQGSNLLLFRDKGRH